MTTKQNKIKCQSCDILIDPTSETSPNDGKIYPFKYGGKTWEVCSLCLKDFKENPTAAFFLDRRPCDCCRMPPGFVFQGATISKLSTTWVGESRYSVCDTCKAGIIKQKTAIKGLVKELERAAKSIRTEAQKAGTEEDLDAILQVLEAELNRNILRRVGGFLGQL